jgi:hypothetical protein
MSFEFPINPKKRRCVGEFITEDTVAIFSFISDSRNYEAELIDPQNQILYKKQNELEVKVSFVATVTGNYEMCIKNNDNSINNIEFQFYSGIQAQDYSSLAKDSNLRPIEINIRKIIDMMKQLIKDLSSVSIKEEENSRINDTIGTKIITFSLLTLIVMIVLGVFETLYIKRYLHTRKVI